MKNLYTLIFIFLSLQLSSQELLVEVSNDSILIGNKIQIEFSVHNMNGDFEAPDLSAFYIVSGPNVSSSMQIINGESSSSKSWSYIAEPKELGEIIIPPAFFSDEEKTVESEVITLNVFPNPEGIIQESYQQKDQFFDFDFPFFDRPQMRTKKDSTTKSKKEDKYAKKLKRI